MNQVRQWLQHLLVQRTYVRVIADENVDLLSTDLIISVSKLTMVEINVSLIIICLSAFQLISVSPSITAIASTASLSTGGGLFRVRTSVSCCFLIDLTANNEKVNMMSEWWPRVVAGYMHISQMLV